MKNHNDISEEEAALRAEETKEKNTEGYPLYPASEDAYSHLIEEQDIDPENPSKLKAQNFDEPGAPERMNEKNFDDEDILSTDLGADLDIPGAELDDAQEKIGSEDEENNYYSIGGDDHNDLEDDRGE